jgi:hypothetical protein
MMVMSNLIYSVQVDFINDSGEKVSVVRTMYDTGLESNSIKVGDVCVIEETINGRVLSGTYRSSELECGYRYNYESENLEDYLVCTNSDVSLNKTVDLINKTKMKHEFFYGLFTFNIVLRKDYRILTLKNPNIAVTRTVSSIDDTSMECECKESVAILKSSRDDIFKERAKRTVYRIDGDVVGDEFSSIAQGNNIEIQMSEQDGAKFDDLRAILEQKPRTHKELLDLLKRGENPTKTMTI